jgi:hypothetical protein
MSAPDRTTNSVGRLVRFGLATDEPCSSLLTQCMVRPCVARSFVDLVCGLASMYPASDWSGSLLRANMDISARSISLPDRPRRGQLGHQCSIALGRPVSISSLPLADLGGEDVACISLLRHRLVSSLVRADGRSFVPACSLDM